MCKQIQMIVIVAFSIIAFGCAHNSLYQRWENQLREMPSHNARVEDVSMLLGTPPKRCESVQSQELTKGEQCYWDILDGQVDSSSSGTHMSPDGGIFRSGGSRYKYFDANCTFNDGFLVRCIINWNE